MLTTLHNLQSLYLRIFQVPESPIWLIAKGRISDAETALCWLRGWVDRSAVQQELTELVTYYERITTKSAQKPDDTEKCEMRNLSTCEPSPELTGLLSRNDIQLSDHQPAKQITIDNAQLPSSENRAPTFREEMTPETNNIGNHDEHQRMISCTEKSITIENGLSKEIFTGDHGGDERTSKFMEMVKLLLEPETLRPLFLTVSFFTLYGFGGMPSIRPFLVEVIESFHAPIGGKWATVSLLQLSD